MNDHNTGDIRGVEIVRLSERVPCSLGVKQQGIEAGADFQVYRDENLFLPQSLVI